jgi:hypothetical protein
MEIHEKRPEAKYKNTNASADVWTFSQKMMGITFLLVQLTQLYIFPALSLSCSSVTRFSRVNLEGSATFQAQIDPLVAPHLAKVKAVAEQVLSKIPKYQKKEEKAEEKKDN